MKARGLLNSYYHCMMANDKLNVFISFLSLFSLTHSRRALFRVFGICFEQIEDILGIILVKEFFKKSN